MFFSSFVERPRISSQVPFSNLAAGRGYAYSQPIRKLVVRCVRKHIIDQSWCLALVTFPENRK